MIVYAKMKSLGSGKIGQRVIKAPCSDSAIRLSFIQDARLYYKVFGRDEARRLLKDTVYSIDKSQLL